LAEALINNREVGEGVQRIGSFLDYQLEKERTR